MINSGTWLQEIGSESTVYSDTAGGESGRPERNPFGTDSVTAMAPNSFYFVPTSGQTSGGTLYIDLPTGTSPGSDVEISDRDGWMAAGYSGSSEAHNYTIANINFLYSNAAQDSTSSSPIPPNSLKMPLSSTLSNCTLEYADFGAVSMSSGCTVTGCTIDYNGDNGLIAGGSCTGLTISNDTIDYNNYRHFDPSWEAGGIKLIASGSGGYEVGQVFGNTIDGNFGCGVWSDSNTENTATTQLLIYDNTVADNAPVPQDYATGEYRVGEAGIKIEVSTYVRVYNNLVLDNYPNGILLSASQNTVVYNNTIAGNRGLAAVWLGGTPRTISETGVNQPLEYDSVENNIIYDNTAEYDLDIQANLTTNGVVNAANNTSNYNLLYRFGNPLQLSTGAYGGGATITSLAAWTSATGHDAGSTSADPHLINPADGNDQLGANSPAIGAGATLDLNGDGSSTDDTDFTGAAIRTAPFDLGAYKFVSGSGNGISDPTAMLDPNAWVDDTLPTGATTTTDAQNSLAGGWNWLAASTPTADPVADVPSPAAESGDLSVIPEEESFSGVASMSFEKATQTMAVVPTDDLYAYVYFDPSETPAEVMIQWEAGSTWHRAYWGANDITSFTGIESDDTGGTTVHVGNLPSQSGWVRLEVPASQVSMNTGTNSSPLQVSGLSLDSYGGQAAWDDIGVVAGAPIAQWTMNEGSGSVVHDTYGNDNGTFIGTPQWGTGKSESDIVLNGASYVDAGNGANLSLASTAANPAMSISGWFDLSDTGGGTYTALGLDKTGSYRLVAYDADTYEDGAATRWQFYVTDSTGATHSCQTTAYYSNDVWQYVVGTYDGDGHLSIYVDGQLAATSSWTGTYTLATTANEFDIGRRDQIARYFPGQIDEVNLFDQALTAAQVSGDFESYFAEIPTAPAAPTDLTAAASSSSISLSWSAPSVPADDSVVYDVYRGTTAGGESSTPIAIGLAAPAFIDTSVTTGQTYFYTVVAINTGGTSGASNEASTALTTVPAWLSAGSVATWNPSTHILTVNGPTSIIADPGADEPIVQASGDYSITLDPAGGTDIHLGGLSLTNGAIATVTSLGSARTISNYHLLVIGTPGATTAPMYMIDSTSTLDLADNDMAILYGSGNSPLSAVASELNRASDGDLWDLPGLTSSVARTTAGVTALGYGEASQLGLTTFDGLTLGGNAVLVKYTLSGDTTLRGAVGLGDYDTVSSNYGSAQGWTGGDFHYGGVVGLSDYNAVLGNYGQTLADFLASSQAAENAIRLAPADSSSAVAPSAGSKIEPKTSKSSRGAVETHHIQTIAARRGKSDKVSLRLV